MEKSGRPTNTGLKAAGGGMGRENRGRSSRTGFSLDNGRSVGRSGLSFFLSGIKRKSRHKTSTYTHDMSNELRTTTM